MIHFWSQCNETGLKKKKKAQELHRYMESEQYAPEDTISHPFIETEMEIAY